MVEELLLQERWIERLARALCRGDEDAARDLAQEARLSLWRRPPPDGAEVRSWLATVVRNLARNRARDEKTRTRLLAETPEERTVPTPEALAARVEIHRQLAALVTALDEPFRQALLLRYYEGMSAADIARRLELPAGTVRWRIKKALDTLRARLDQQHGARERWLGILAPFTAAEIEAPRATPARAGVTLLLAGGIATVLVGGGVALKAKAKARAATETRTSVASTETRQVPTTTTTSGARSRRSAALLSVVLPTLAAAADAETPLTEAEALAACLEIKQQAVRCSGELADSYVVNLPLDRRATFRQRAAAEIVEEGSGPTPFREESCRKHIRYKTFTRADRTGMSACAAADCAAFVRCARPFFDRFIEPPKVSHARAQAIAARAGQGDVPIAVDDQVVEALNRLVGTNEGRRKTREALARMREHEATVDAALGAAGVPRDLAAVALLESGFDGAAASKNASGIWQLTKGTAKQYGLTVDDGLDERLDPRRSSGAAASLLRDLHRQFGDWDLAIAAYNEGPGAVSRAIQQGGTRDAAELRARGLLQAYQPGVMAAMLVLRDRSLVD